MTIPTDVKAFILEKVDSVEQLEIVCRMHADQSLAWTADELSQALRSSGDSIARRMVDLEGKGVVVSDGATPPRYSWKPKTPALAQTLDDLVKAYAERRVSVINLIFSKPLERIQVFADAFRIKKDRDDG